MARLCLEPVERGFNVSEQSEPNHAMVHGSPQDIKGPPNGVLHEGNVFAWTELCVQLYSLLGMAASAGQVAHRVFGAASTLMLDGMGFTVLHDATSNTTKSCHSEN